jgi:hypothetical protein
VVGDVGFQLNQFIYAEAVHQVVAYSASASDDRWSANDNDNSPTDCLIGKAESILPGHVRTPGFVPEATDQ